MRLSISHTTTYTYEEPVPYGLQELRLRPRTLPGQTVETWQTDIVGATSQARFEDEYANDVELISLDPGVTESTVTARGEVETVDTAGIVARHMGHAPLWFFERSTPLTEAGPTISDLCGEFGSIDGDPVTRLHELSALVRERVRYEQYRTDAESTAEEVLLAGRGVCQDHSHVFLAAARTLGLPARYVSGYLLMDDDVAQDASHAWADVWIGSLGWVGFDISNGISPDERYVRIATGLDYRAAAPVSGVRFGLGLESMRVDLEIIDEGRAGQQ